MVDGRRPLFIWIIEAFGLVTAFAFVVSAVANAVIFWLAWNVNYFVVASPADVVMTGFMLVPLTLLSVALFAVAFGAMVLAGHILGRIAHHMLGGMKRLPVQDPASASRLHWSRDLKIQGPMMLVGAIGVVAALISIFLEIGTTRVERLVDTGGNPPASSGKSEPEIAGGTRNPDPTAGTENPKERGQFSYATGLRLTSDFPDPECAGGPVLWLGSERMIVGCRSSIQVIHQPDGLVMEQLNRRRSDGSRAR